MSFELRAGTLALTLALSPRRGEGVFHVRVLSFDFGSGRVFNHRRTRINTDYQGQGIGTALLLARIALLKANQPAYGVYIATVKKAIGYYSRFGFQTIGSWKDKEGKDHPLAALELLRLDILKARKLLAKHQVVYPADEGQVPDGCDFKFGGGG